MGLLDAFSAPIYRWLYPDPMFAETAGSDGDTQGAREMYNARNALSAMAAFPWVMACLEVISTDLSGVPLVAVRTDPNTGKREIERNHPVLEMLKRPSPQTGGVAMRRQLYADFAAAREAYIRIMGKPGVDGIALRLHPVDIEPQIDPATGLIEFYKWGENKIPADQILMIRGLGWENGIRSSRAESPIKPLQQGLKAAQDARKFAQKSAQNGRLEMLLKPSDPVAQFGKSGVEAIKEMYLRAKRDGSGAFVLNRAIDAVPLSISSREMEFSELDSRVRDEVLAVFGVPPVLVGLPGANYGTARQQSRTYWERRKHDAALFDDELSRLTGDPNVRIEHDFTDVEALQTSRSERQMRASIWITAFGMSPKEAASYENFDDAPIDESVTAEDMKAPRPSAPSVNEPQEDNGEGKAIAVGVWQDGAAVRYQERALSGDMQPSHKALEAGMLAGELIRAGVPPQRATSVAVEMACIVHDSVSTIVDSSDADGVLGVRTLRCFGADFASLIVSRLEAA